MARKSPTNCVVVGPLIEVLREIERGPLALLVRRL